MASFATTHWSLVNRSVGDDAEAGALNELCRSYWTPVFEFVRRAGQGEEEARDLTQAFFARVLAKDWLALADPDRGRFRTFLLTLLKRFMADAWDHQRRAKRGGQVEHLPMDGPEGGRIADGGASPDEWFDRRWAETLMGLAAARLRREAVASGKQELFEALTPWLTSEPEAAVYQTIGERFRMSRGAVAMAVHRLRARLREMVRREVAETLADGADVEAELQALKEALRR